MHQILCFGVVWHPTSYADAAFRQGFRMGEGYLGQSDSVLILHSAVWLMSIGNDFLSVSCIEIFAEHRPPFCRGHPMAHPPAISQSAIALR